MKLVVACVLAVSFSSPALAETPRATPDATPSPKVAAASAMPALKDPMLPSPRGREVLVFAGVQLGILLPLGVNGALMFTKNAHPEWDVDVSWEPSNYWQSYSVAGAYHPLANAFFFGPRVRLLQLHAPWTRGYDSELDRQLGLGAELGLRSWFDKEQRWLGSLSVGAIYVASDNTSLPVLYTLNLGLAYQAYKHTMGN